MWCFQRNSSASCQPKGPTQFLQVWLSRGRRKSEHCLGCPLQETKKWAQVWVSRRWDCWLWLRSDWESVWTYINRWSCTVAYLVRKCHCKLQERDGHPWTPSLTGLSLDLSALEMEMCFLLWWLVGNQSLLLSNSSIFSLEWHLHQHFCRCNTHWFARSLQEVAMMQTVRTVKRNLSRRNLMDQVWRQSVSLLLPCSFDQWPVTETA